MSDNKAAEEFLKKYETGERDFSCVIVEQEALSPAPQNTERAPDPEGEYQWVPKGFVVVPEEPNLDMLVFGERAEPIARNIYPSKIYKAMIAARPPVPKKGERV